jgi:prepilin-type N-terminal cleavage/methylation domain-containing protein
MKAAHVRAAGFTLIEMIVAMGMVGAIGSVVFTILNTGAVLYAKNTAINVAHQQARVAVMQAETDLHSSVSLPQLVDTSRAPVDPSQSAAGISFQLFAAGPFKVTAQAAAGQNTITMGLGSYQPKAGQRLIIPTHQIELDIAADCPGSGARLVTLSAPLPNAVDIQLDDAGVLQNVDVIGFITDRVTYVVTNGELRYYGRGNSNSYTVLANSITSATPFSTPQTPAGAPYYRFVAAINLSTADTSVNNRGFKAANMFLNAQVPCRTRLCSYQ